MAAFESSYKSLLQGVSQQIPRERLPGQLTAQENMLSDPVTNPRRRPGEEYKFSLALPGAAHDNIKAWYTDIAGSTVHIILNCADGTIKVLDNAYATLATLAGGSYLTTTKPEDIRAATIGDELFLLNVAVKPTEVAAVGGTNPNLRGYFYVSAGAFSKQYSVTLKNANGSVTGTYTTPTGSGAGDAALATPTYIAGQILASLNTNGAAGLGFTLTSTTAYVYVASSVATCTVNSDTGSAYLQVSKDAYTNVVGNLPATLPSGADGFTMRVGDLRLPQYYKFNATSTAWLESGDFSSPASIDNMPVSVTKVGATWTLKTDDFEGRLAGDDESNPNPRFLDNGITGMGTYQGRLVLLSGALVRLSASNKPRRFYRSTITSVIDSDSIEVGSSGNSSASYQYAIPFQKDLVLFSAEYQALIPSGNQAINPRTATVVLTSSHAADMSSQPVTLGRTLMYATPFSENFFGVLEMVPSQYTDSQYISVPATPHLPKYFGGRCRFSVSSGVSGTVLFAPSSDPFSIIVHEYEWSGDQKAQSAWHRWTFPYEIAAAYFANEQIVILHAQNDVVVGAVLDPRTGLLTESADRRPFLDMYSNTTIVGNVVTVPTWMTNFDPDIKTRLKLCLTNGALAGEPVGFSIDGANLRTVRSHSSGDVAVGIPYQSLLSPTPPVVRDANEVAISTNKISILRYIVGTDNSGEYVVLVRDNNSSNPEAVAQGTLYWSSLELDTGAARTANESWAVVPCRTNAGSTTLLIYTEGMHELNVISLEYVLKYNQKIRRR
jgi:hypothetical protein